MSTRVDTARVTIVGVYPEDPEHARREELCRALLRELTTAETVVEARANLLGLDLEHTTWRLVRAAITPSLRWCVIGPGPGGPESATGEVLTLPLTHRDGVVLLHDAERERVILTANGSGDAISLRRVRRARA
jgi:hypothetical protein